MSELLFLSQHSLQIQYVLGNGTLSDTMFLLFRFGVVWSLPRLAHSIFCVTTDEINFAENLFARNAVRRKGHYNCALLIIYRIF